MSGIPRETYEFTKQIPFSEHLGIKVDSLEKGVARLSMAMRPEFMTSWGTAHGGSILALLDITLSMTARTLYDPPRSIMTIRARASPSVVTRLADVRMAVLLDAAAAVRHSISRRS